MKETKNRQIVAMIPEDILKRLKHISAEKLVSTKSLLVEAIQDLLKKYEIRN